MGTPSNLPRWHSHETCCFASPSPRRRVCVSAGPRPGHDRPLVGPAGERAGCGPASWNRAPGPVRCPTSEHHPSTQRSTTRGQAGPGPRPAPARARRTCPPKSWNQGADRRSFEAVGSRAPRSQNCRMPGRPFLPPWVGRRRHHRRVRGPGARSARQGNVAVPFSPDPVRYVDPVVVVRVAGSTPTKSLIRRN
jgi:hypothetical protein